MTQNIHELINVPQMILSACTHVSLVKSICIHVKIYIEREKEKGRRELSFRHLFGFNFPSFWPTVQSHPPFSHSLDTNAEILSGRPIFVNPLTSSITWADIHHGAKNGDPKYLCWRIRVMRRGKRESFKPWNEMDHMLDIYLRIVEIEINVRE